METVTMFDDAYSTITNYLQAPSRELVSVREALGQVLATDAIANINVPPFSRSMMDGFAVHAADLLRGAEVSVMQTTAAGDRAGTPVSPGHAVRVMTGAPVPEGAAAVIRDEWCEAVGPSVIRVLRSAKMGESIQITGDDGTSGQTLIKAGRRLTELDIAVLQTFGIPEVEVFQRISAALIITGTELVADVRTPLRDGQIYGTNDTLLKGALEADGIDVTDVQFIPDNLLQLQTAVANSAKNHPLVIITGGVSVGDFDYTPRAVEHIGSTIHLRKILMRPGSPFVFATIGKTAIFGLSGNPAACFAQFSALVRPAMRALLGQDDKPFPYMGILSHDVSLKPIKHTRVQRAKVTLQDGRILVDCGLSQSTGVISSFVDTNAYVRLDNPEYSAGAVVPLRFVKEI